MFSKGTSVFVHLLVCMGIYFAPARGSSVSVGDHIMTSKDYIKVEHVRTWLFISSFANFQQFRSECFFSKFCLVYFLQFTRAIFVVFAREKLIFCLQNLCVQLFFFLHGRKSFSCYFFGLKLQTVSSLNPCFRKVFLFYAFKVMLIL